MSNELEKRHAINLKITIYFYEINDISTSINYIRISFRILSHNNIQLDKNL